MPTEKLKKGQGVTWQRESWLHYSLHDLAAVQINYQIMHIASLDHKHFEEDKHEQT